MITSHLMGLRVERNKMETMKTFYTVNYRPWGSSFVSVRYFDNLQKAKDFSKNDYCDKVVVHNIKDPERIREFKQLVDVEE